LLLPLFYMLPQPRKVPTGSDYLSDVPCEHNPGRQRRTTGTHLVFFGH
jgi:hypothetical protein